MRGSSNLKALDSRLSRGIDRSYAVLAWCVFALSFCKGFRFPSTWAATHFAFNYSQGFMRRALVGELARRIGGDDVYRYDVFCALSFASLALAVVLFSLAARRALRRDSGDWALRIALLVFCASPGVVVLAHLVGYLDYVGILAVLALLNWSARRRGRYTAFYLLTLGGAVLTLIHEGLVVMFAPTALFVAVCQWLRDRDGQPPAVREWCWLVAHMVAASLLLSGCVFAVVGASGAEHVPALRAFMERHADFQVRRDAFDVFTTSLRENALQVVPAFWRLPGAVPPALSGCIAFVPGFVFILWCGLRELRAARRAFRTLLPLLAVLALFLGAAVAPELMNIAGWDWPRWNSIALVNAGVCVLAFKLSFANEARAGATLPLLTCGLALTAVGLASTTMLFDAYQVQFFPFDRPVQDIERAFRRGVSSGVR